MSEPRNPSGQGSVEALADLFELAEGQPLEALRIWKETYMSRIQQEGDGPGPLGRRFERLARIALEHAEPRLREEVTRSIVEVRDRLEALADPHRRKAAAFATGFQKGARSAARQGLAPVRPPEMRELRDVFQLEDFIAERSEAEALAWLIQGMENMRNDPARAHLAFRPLRLMPGQRLIEQLAGALNAGIEAGAHAPLLLRAAIKGYLKRDQGLPAPRLEVDLDFWRLFANLHPKAADIADVRGYLIWLVGTGARPEQTEPVVRAVCDLVARCTPVTGAQSAFFRWLKRATTLWMPIYERDLVNAEAAEARRGLISNVVSEDEALRQSLVENRGLIAKGVSSGDEELRDLIEALARRLDPEGGRKTLEDAARQLLSLETPDDEQRVMEMPAAANVGDHQNLTSRLKELVA